MNVGGFHVTVSCTFRPPPHPSRLADAEEQLWYSRRSGEVRERCRPAKRATRRAGATVVDPKSQPVAPPRGRDQHELVIISGMSGAGKASALNTFEDLGYYCVDNLPVGLISNFAELVLDSLEIQRAALVVDIREGARLDKLPQVLASLRRMLKTTVIFLEADERGTGPPLQ